MPAPIRKPTSELTLDDLRSMVVSVRKDGLQIQRHYKRLEQEYSDWEDRINELDKIIAQAEIDTGITKEQIYAPDSSLFDDLSSVQETDSRDIFNEL